MAKPPSPLLGFNNNVKHQGRIFHVQTEDSGINRPHILTHLFVDGGRILKSQRTDYSEHIGRADMNVVVRRMMKEQHKGMFIALRDGQLDETIEAMLGPVASEAGPATEEPLASASEGAAKSARRRSKPAPTMPDVPVPQIDSLPPAPVIVAEARRSPAPIPRPAAPTLTDLVLADLEAARARGLPAQAPGGAKPPGRGGTPVLGTPTIGTQISEAPPLGGVPLPSRPPPASRYAASRPAAIFTSSPQQGSIFGGSSISEQSLDEVILSYLAEDLDGTAEE
ncbi:MAG TPA: hypothetical protein VF395_09225 [Polyangiaceae bacterium]